MSPVVLVAVVAGSVTTAALITWWYIRALNKRIRRLKADAAADRYRADIYRNALIDITRMGYPHQTLRDAHGRAEQALQHLKAAS